MNRKKLRPLRVKETELINRCGLSVKVVKLEPMKPMARRPRADRKQ